MKRAARERAERRRVAGGLRSTRDCPVGKAEWISESWGEEKDFQRGRVGRDA